MVEEIRKIQLTGGTTFIVSLPKKWVKQYNLKPGDPVYIQITHDGNLLISVKRSQEKSLEARLKVKKMDTLGKVARDIVAYYLAGYEKIIVEFQTEMPEYKIFIKKFIKDKMIGLELIEEGKNYIIIQTLVKHIDFPIKKAIERMSIIVSFMIDDAIKALIHDQKELAKSIVETDDDVDRLYIFTVRQLNSVVGHPYKLLEVGLKSNKECLSYRLLAKSIERVGDHAMKIAKVAMSNDMNIPGDIKHEISMVASELRKIFEEAINAALNKDKDKAHELLDNFDHFRNLQDNLIRKLMNLEDIRLALNLRVVAESLRRIADYSADIAEIAINMSVHGVEYG